MAQASIGSGRGAAAPSALVTFGRAWGRISSRFVPLLAVLTALIVTIPFMMVTGGRGSLAEGLNIAGTAYAALIEGSVGLVINDQVSADDLDQLVALARGGGTLERPELRPLARAVGRLVAFGMDDARRYGTALAPFAALDNDRLQTLASSAADLQALSLVALEQARPLVGDLDQLARGEARELAQRYAALAALSADDRADLEALLPTAANYSDADLLAALKLVDQEGVVKLLRLLGAVDAFAAAGIAPDAPEAAALAEIARVDGGVAAAREAAATVVRLDQANITNAAALAEQIEVVRSMYAFQLLTEDDVVAAVADQLDDALADHLIVRRPGNRLVCTTGTAPFGVIYTPVIGSSTTCDIPAPDVAEANGLPATRVDILYLRLPGRALLFFPYNLEDMLVRSIPFIIAGLAVALGFKAGLFNIGAEGQLYAGGLLAVWVGFSPLFAGLPWFVHVPLVIVVGILGGALWGAVPGALKAFTGAHEVIVTIMLNYIMIRFVDWIIKSTNPIILLDPSASTPRTPFINPSAVMPRFSEIPLWLILLAGAAVVALGLYRRQDRLARFPLLALRPIVGGLIVIALGVFLSYINVRGSLHIGILIMLGAVWFTDWFLNRTTPGFELRTVGSNPNAARYAGMSVRRNMIFAMALSGALAGLAGTIEISAVQQNMKPEFFAGLGFEAIAVALLARSSPRSMIMSGLLWGGLLSGAGLMQVRADISIDLVKIIQALIIMFIAADAIIRALWRVPPPTEKTATTFTSWGSGR